MINDEYLHAMCEDVVDPISVVDIITDMLDTMYDSKDRHPVGLAANQIGYNKRIIVINTGTFKEVMINPVITKSSQRTSTMEEGCLSFSKDFLVKVTVEWVNTSCRTKKQKFRGLDAIVIQHEIDHLNGITIEDKLAEYLAN